MLRYKTHSSYCIHGFCPSLSHPYCTVLETTGSCFSPPTRLMSLGINVLMPFFWTKELAWDFVMLFYTRMRNSLPKSGCSPECSHLLHSQSLCIKKCLLVPLRAFLLALLSKSQSLSHALALQTKKNKPCEYSQVNSDMVRKYWEMPVPATFF